MIDLKCLLLIVSLSASPTCYLKANASDTEVYQSISVNDRSVVLNTINATIKSAGGIIHDKSSGIVLEFPEGWASETIEIKFHLLLHDKSDYVQHMFILEGLPNKTHKELEVSTKLTCSLNAQSYLLFDYDTTGILSNKQSFVRDVYQMKSNNNRKTAILKPYAISLQQQATDRPVKADAFSGMALFSIISNYASLKSSKSNFILLYPKNIPDKSLLNTIAVELERALVFITDTIGLPYKLRDTQQNPVKVVFTPFKINNFPIIGRHFSHSPDAWGYASFSLFNRNRDVLELNTLKFEHDDALSQLVATAHHEFFHLIQACYAPISGDTAEWLGEASSVWLEMALSSTDYWPSVVAEEDMAFVKNGLFNLSDTALTNVQEHGYASSVFLRYMTDLAGYPLFVRDLWLNYEKGIEKAFKIAAKNDNSWYLHWVNFIKAIYQSESSFFPTKWHHMEMVTHMSEYYFNIRDINKSAETFSIKSAPLSSQAIMVRIGAKAFDPAKSADLVVKTTGLPENVQIVVVDPQGQILAEAFGYDDITIPDLHRYSGDISIQKRYLAIVIINANNPSVQSSKIKLSTKITGKL